MDDTPPMAPEERWAPYLTAPPPPARPAAARRHRARGPVAAVVAVALAIGATSGWIANATTGSDDAPPTTAASPASVRLDGDTMDVAGIVASLKPSVVSIETQISIQRGFRVATGSGAGTGVVLDKGLVLTNAHVVEGATRVQVTGADGRPRAAAVVNADTNADIAVVRVSDASGLVPAKLGRDGDVAVGDDVVAIGNALALEGGLTVTRGIVSALDRSIETGTGTLTGLVQTDAAISSGNSGGALVNAAGQVIGINTAVAASGGSVTASNIGFAISIDHAMATVARLLKETP